MGKLLAVIGNAIVGAVVIAAIAAAYLAAYTLIVGWGVYVAKVVWQW